MSMPENDPRRMDEIRRYAAIYGRFDCKRRPEKPLTLHEVSVNEAAAQICRFIPALLTRRDELFPLARQVVKDSGCHYSKTQYMTNYATRTGAIHDREIIDMSGSISGRGSSRVSSSEQDLPSSKKLKLDEESADEGSKRQDKHIASDDSGNARSSLHLLFQNHSKSTRETLGRCSSLVTDDETDSHFSFSNSSSPSQIGVQEQETYSSMENHIQSEENSETADDSKFSPKVQVIAASGDNIIAVANPALAMSPAILPLSIESREHKMSDQ